MYEYKERCTGDVGDIFHWLNLVTCIRRCTHRQPYAQGEINPVLLCVDEQVFFRSPEVQVERHVR